MTYCSAQMPDTAEDSLTAYRCVSLLVALSRLLTALSPQGLETEHKCIHTEVPVNDRHKSKVLPFCPSSALYSLLTKQCIQVSARRAGRASWGAHGHSRGDERGHATPKGTWGA